MDAVEELLAKEAIREVVYRYCRGLDRMDRDLALSCWHPGGTSDYGDTYEGTGEGFIDWVWPVHREGFVAHSHQITNLLIAVEGDAAASEAYVTVTLRSRVGSGPAVDIVGRGRYLDRWSRRDGVWAIDHRRHVTDVQSIYPSPLDDGSAALSSASRDRSDPSYDLLGSLSRSDPPQHGPRFDDRAWS